MKPAAIKLIEGNPGQRRIPVEPKFRPVAPECPDFLRGDAQKEWERLAPTLERLGLLTEADQSNFAGYCQAWARWKAAEQEVDRVGITYERRKIEMAEDGNTFVSLTIFAQPAVGVALRERMSMMRLGALFGLSPSDRGRLNLPLEKSDDRKARMVD